jgi:hypothetical protein
MVGTLIEKAPMPTLKDPVLISAFTSDQKAGASATSTLAYLLSEWNAELVAEFESDHLYNLSRIRPQVRMDGDKRVVDWPTNMVYLATPPGTDRSFLILIGMEPQYGWKGLVAEIADFALKAGVRTAVSLRALPAGTSHRQPVPLQALYSDKAMVNVWRIPEEAHAEGALDIAAVLNMQLQSIGCETVDIYALEPYYVPATPLVGTSIALIDALDDAFGLDTPTVELAEMEAVQLAAINNLVEQSKELQAVIGALEGARGPRFLLGPGEHKGEGAPLDAEEVIGDIEAMLGLDQSAGGDDEA